MSVVWWDPVGAELYLGRAGRVLARPVTHWECVCRRAGSLRGGLAEEAGPEGQQGWWARNGRPCSILALLGWPHLSFPQHLSN